MGNFAARDLPVLVLLLGFIRMVIAYAAYGRVGIYVAENDRHRIREQVTHLKEIIMAFKHKAAKKVEQQRTNGAGGG